ncbi:signal peptidase complex-like protein DTM1 [Thalictrum thalictroides]|uniref:Signal peptidase complex-like protein DTM1 n=1 Tax=Thalictrum thalictroides TaxID=46969 RepID=A0A7J6VIC2_THATH|nr:signal peptidase complex-like protein DTM1 [Thalictrum thalictroides]
MFATYVFGILAISGILLPDWEFFDRDFSQWVYPMSADNDSAQNPRSKRFRFYPVRVVLYTTIYSFGLYKWWMYVFNT